jgi:hypothetical protein
MSDRVTWESCPHCGGLAAVGWARVSPSGGGPAEYRPVEFDCTTGCQSGPAELLHLAADDPYADQP